MKPSQTIFTDAEIARMKTRLRAMEHRRDNIAISIAIEQNLPNLWSIDMIDWNSVNDETRTKFNTLVADIADLDDEIRQATAIKEDNYNFYIAEKKVYAFLNRLSIDEVAGYLRELGLTTHGLIGEVEKNPNFISETYKKEVKV